METLHTTLDSALQGYRQNNDLESFLSTCSIELAKASTSELSHHRGYKQIIANILIALTGVGLIYIYIASLTKLCEPDRSCFFNPKTNSVKLIDSLQKHIQEIREAAQASAEVSYSEDYTNSIS